VLFIPYSFHGNPPLPFTSSISKSTDQLLHNMKTMLFRKLLFVATLSSLLAMDSACLAFEVGQLQGRVPIGPSHNGKICIVRAHGKQKDDTPQILEAFKDCNNGGTVVFPRDQNYWIATKLNPVIYDVTVDWEGTWTVRTADLKFRVPIPVDFD
jgi:hypothetical protein